MTIRTRKFIFPLMFVTSLLFGGRGFSASADRLTMADDLKMKAELEKVIAERYSELIGTRLHRSEFHVSVLVRLDKKTIEPKATAPAVIKTQETANTHAAAAVPTKLPARNIASTQLATQQMSMDLEDESVNDPSAPLDLTLGMINADTLLKNQKAEIRALRSQLRSPASEVVVHEATPAPAQAISVQPIIHITTNGTAAEAKTVYRVTKVNLTVGLASHFPESYRSEFGAWFNRQVNAEFDRMATVDIGTLRPEPKTEQVAQTPQAPMKEPANSVQLLSPMAEWAKSVQNVLGLSILALALIAMAFVWRATKLASGPEHNISVNIDQPASARPEMNSNEDVFPLEMPVAAIADGAHFDRWISERKKLRPLMEEIGSKLGPLVRSWIEGGAEGQTKAAVFIDALAHDDESKVKWDLPIPAEYADVMANTFGMMSSLPIEKRIKIIENVYWDLIGLKTLQRQPITSRFSFFSTAKSSVSEAWFAQAKPSHQAVVLLFVTGEVKQTFMQSLTAENLQVVLTEALMWENSSAEEITQIERTIQSELKAFAQSHRTSVVQNEIMSLLSSLTLLEEMRLWPRLVQNLSDGGRFLRRQKPTLAFFADWTANARQALLKEATYDDLTLFLKIRPEFWEATVEVCAPRLQAMLQEDRGSLNQNTIVDEKKAEQVLRKLQNRLVHLLEKREVKKDELSSMPEQEQQIAAA